MSPFQERIQHKLYKLGAETYEQDVDILARKDWEVRRAGLGAFVRRAAIVTLVAGTALWVAAEAYSEASSEDPGPAETVLNDEAY